MSGIGDAATALGANVATALYGVSGEGIKIGIISDSYNANGGAAANVTEGYLPTSVTVLNDSPDGTDEGQAMMELAYQIAPNANYYFAAGGDSVESCAAAVTALQDAGCTVIIDDLGYATGESFFQTGTALDLAIQSAVGAGVNYFSAAGNDGADYVEQGFAPLSVAIPGIGAVVANDFGNSNPYLDVTIPRGASGNLVLEWAQPFASIGTGSPGAANSLALYLLDAQGNVVASSTVDEIGDNPIQFVGFTNTTASTQFRLVVVQNAGTTPAGQTFIVSNSNSAASIVSAGAGGGTGNILGHELLSDTNVVGAVTYTDTPAFGSPPVVASYSSTGPGVILFDQNGNPLTTPVTPGSPTYTSVSGSSTTVPGFESFNGTSAAAPNAGAVGALMLEADGGLTTAQLSDLLAESTIPVASNLPNTGAGLIQARAGVELANAAGGTRWSNAAGGNWNTAANWSGGAQPGTDGAVMLGDDLGAVTGSYTVTVDTAGDAAGSLTLSAPAGSTSALVIAEGGALAIGGSAAANRTAGDFLVAGNGVLKLDRGSLSVSGSLNSNNGSILLSAGQATAGNFTQNAGSITVGGGAADASITLNGAGFTATGGTATIDAGGTIQTTAFGASAATIGIAAGGTVTASGDATFNNTTLTEGGTFQSAAFNVYGGAVDIATTGMVTTQSVGLGYSLGGMTTAASVTVNGQLVDQGSLGMGVSAGAGSIAIGSTGALLVGGSTSGVGISFLGSGGLLDFTSADSAVLTSALDALIYGFSADTGIIEFGALTYNPLDSYDYANGSLGIYLDGTNLANLALDPSLSYGGFAFSAGSDDSLEIASLACFAAGTRIETARGPVAVEALRLGDQVRTAAGAMQPVVWLGHRRVDCARHPEPQAVWPVCISADAFGPGLPCRDLTLSPDHAIFAEGVLIPVKYLIDGQLIRQRPTDSIIYFHVELPEHDILLAENLAAESYLDTGDRASFAEGTVTALHPAWGQARMDVTLQIEAASYAPLRVTGPEVDRVRAALSRRTAAQAFAFLSSVR
ncbi:MAG TPA: Hint domain-containing protein [Acidisoma sp.]|uniref:Hint domain-containing protein n=1 Tax=Acidisoma sp. TaxID=1872115 RepID=UPI002C0EE838|nr:Hint domain-containing protein [Acidisoma sp.]HTH99800.1 Hint domain-containing protein [Acidisoma sp.]